MNQNISMGWALAIIGAVLLGVAGLFMPFVQTQQLAGASPAGTTFNTAKIAAVSMAPLTAGATSTSILNTDANGRWVADFGFAGCTGLGTSRTFPDTGTGLANLLVQAATTSVANQGLQGNTNYALNLTLATTSTAFSNNSTSTTPVMGGYWAAGSYMTFTFNATSTGACVVEVDYVAS